MSRWFRLYDDLVDDPKVQQLPAATFKGLINLWCVASKNDGRLPALADIAFKLRMPVAKAQQLVGDLMEARLIDEDEDTLRPHNWNGRQFKSDNVSERVKKHREKQRETVSETLHVTPPETETETETERTEPPSPPKGGKTRGSFLDPDWKPDANLWAYGAEKLGAMDRAEREFEKFRNHFLSRSGEIARKRDWPRALMNWWLKAAESLPPIDRTTPAVPPPERQVFVAVGTAEWDAWQRVRKTSSFKSEAHGVEGWHFPSQWPTHATGGG